MVRTYPSVPTNNCECLVLILAVDQNILEGCNKHTRNCQHGDLQARRHVTPSTPNKTCSRSPCTPLSLSTGQLNQHFSLRIISDNPSLVSSFPPTVRRVSHFPTRRSLPQELPTWRSGWSTGVHKEEVGGGVLGRYPRMAVIDGMGAMSRMRESGDGER
eukprot:753858-Hanusia_phi.AAC.9